MTFRRAAAAAALVGLWGVAAEAPSVRAESRPRVLLVIEHGDDPFAERVRAELVGLGLEVVALEPWRTGEPVQSLEAAGRAEQAAAAIRMIPSRKGVEIWMANQPTGRSLLRELIVDERPGGPNEGLVALQTAELLRTSLGAPPPTRAASSPAATPASPPPPTEATPVTARATARPTDEEAGGAGVQAGLGALGSPGAGDAAAQLWLSFHRRLRPRLAIALDLSGPVRAGTLHGPEGAAEVGGYLAGVALMTDFALPVDGLYLDAAAGLAAVRVVTSGVAIPSLASASEGATTVAGYLRADLGVEATRWLRVGLRLCVGASPTGVRIRFAGNDAGTWGRPFLGALLVADASWR